MERKMYKNGISLMLLVVTIVIVLILVSTSVIILMQTGILKSKEELQFKNDMSQYSEKIKNDLASKTIEGVISGNDIVSYVPLLEGNKYLDAMFIVDARLYLDGTMTETISEEEIKWAKEIGIDVSYNGKTIDSEEVMNSVTMEYDNTCGKKDVEISLSYAGEKSDIYYIQYKVNDGEWKIGKKVLVTENNTTVYGRVYSSYYNKTIAQSSVKITNIDRLPPTGATTLGNTPTYDTISVNASGAEDHECGGVAGYKYSMDATNYSSLVAPDVKHTFSGLRIGRTYDVYIITVDGVGNTSEAVKKQATTNNVNQKVILAASTTVVTPGPVIVSLSHPSIPNGYVIQYKLANGSWTTGTSVPVSTNQIVEGRLYNANYPEEQNIALNSITISNIDVMPPTIAFSNYNGGRYCKYTYNEDIYNTSLVSDGKPELRCTITANDASGIKNLYYAWSTSNTVEPTNWTAMTNGTQINYTTARANNTYYLWAKAIDGANISKVSVSNPFESFSTTTSNLITLTVSPNDYDVWEKKRTITATFDSCFVSKTLTYSPTYSSYDSSYYTINGTSSIEARVDGVAIATGTDKAGNITTVRCHVYKIDSIAPEITTLEWQRNYGISNLIAKDNDGGSGIAEQGYASSGYTEPYTTTLSWTKQYILMSRYDDGGYRESYEFTVYVKDNAGNIGEKTCTVSNGTCECENECPHNWGSWHEYDSSRHEATCTLCSANKYATHTFGGIVYTNGGSTGEYRTTCSTCGYVHYGYTNPTTPTDPTTPTCSHSMKYTEISDTQHKYACTKCDYVQSTEDHTCGSWTANGPQGHKKTCSKCGYVKTANHTTGETTSDGNTTHSVYCGTSGCGYKISTTAHTWGSWTSNGNSNHIRICTAPGCDQPDTQNHSFKVCGGTTVDIDISSYEESNGKYIYTGSCGGECKLGIDYYSSIKLTSGGRYSFVGGGINYASCPRKKCTICNLDWTFFH